MPSKTVASEPTAAEPAWKKLQNWNELVREMELPAEIAIAISASRVELLEPLRRRIINSPDDAKDFALPLLHTVEVLLETNRALQQHAAEAAKKADDLHDNLRGAFGSADKLLAFLNFRNPEAIDADD